MADLNERLGTKLRTLRGNRPLRVMAAKLGVSVSTLHELELGRQNVTIATLQKFCDRLNCDIADLFTS